jgi:hypothetical protein
MSPYCLGFSELSEPLMRAYWLQAFGPALSALSIADINKVSPPSARNLKKRRGLNLLNAFNFNNLIT